jgi:hypothetical protein
LSVFSSRTTIAWVLQAFGLLLNKPFGNLISHHLRIVLISAIVHSAVGYEMMVFEIETKLWHCQEQEAITTSVPPQSLKRSWLDQSNGKTLGATRVADGLPRLRLLPDFALHRGGNRNCCRFTD